MLVGTPLTMPYFWIPGKCKELEDDLIALEIVRLFSVGAEVDWVSRINDLSCLVVTVYDLRKTRGVESNQ